MDFDDILNILGAGPWNFVYFLAISSVSFWLPCIVIAGTFVAPNVDFDCIVPEQEYGNVSTVEKCFYITGTNNSNFHQSEMKHKCTDFDFNQTESAESLTSMFNLVCDNSYLRPSYQTAYMIGNIFGAPISGFLSDRYGRKLVIASTLVLGVASVLISFAFRDIIYIIGARFITGTCFHSMLLCSFTLFMESCPAKHRSTAGIYFSLPWAFGTMWWGGLGYLFRDWRLLQTMSLLPALILLICLCIYDDSARWLIVSGHHEKALEALRRAARWNKAVLPPDDELLEIMQSIQKTTVTSRGASIEKKSNYKRFKNVIKRVFILFRTPKLRKITFLMYLTFFVSGNVYYGLSLNAGNFKLDPYLYIVVVGVTEIPAYLFTGWFIGKFGRIPIACISFLVCGGTILALAFIPQEVAWAVYTLAIIGTTFIASGFQIVFLMATEVFPTEVRLQGFGTSSFLSSVGGGVAPFITDLLGSYYNWFPSMIFGGLSLLAGFAMLFLPETLNRHMPETIQIMEELARA